MTERQVAESSLVPVTNYHIVLWRIKDVKDSMGAKHIINNVNDDDDDNDKTTISCSASNYSIICSVYISVVFTVIARAASLKITK